MANTTERRVKIRLFDYIDEDGNKISARRGDVISVNDEDLAKGNQIGAFAPESETHPEEVQEDDAGSAIEIHAMSADELALYIEREKPSVNELLQLANGDTAIAKKILKAENSATGNDPRKSLVQGIEKVIAAAGQ